MKMWGDFTEDSYLEFIGLSEGLYDFTLCKRKNNTYYGIGDGLKCRKGEESAKEREEKERLLSTVASVKDRAGLLAAFKKLTDAELESVASLGAKVIDENQTYDSVRKQSSGYQYGHGTLSWSELEALKKNRSKLIAADKDPTLLTGSLRKVSDNEVEAFSKLTGVSYKDLGGAGLVAGRVGLREDGSYGKGSDWRGKQLLKRFLEQDGKDIYTGLPVSLKNATMEHIQSYARVGPKEAESRKNWAWTSQALNDLKGKKTFETFIDGSVTKALSSDRKKYDKDYEDERKSRVRAFRLRADKLGVQSIADKLADAYKDKGHMVLQHLRRPSNRNANSVVKYGNALKGRWSDDKLGTKPGETYSQWIIRAWPKATDAQREKIVDISQELDKTKFRSREDRMAAAKERFTSLGL